MAGFLCPYCSMVMTISHDTLKTRKTSFHNESGVYYNGKCYEENESCIEIDFYDCPNCGEISIQLKGIGDSVSDIKQVNIRPRSFAKQFPEYIPETIRNDYEEACAIVDLSPKASATLSRRCLQSMIRDFWEITGKRRLVDEIDALENKVPPTQWRVINSLRRIGNIGAHPEADVNLIIDIEPNDAKKLISIIELLIKQWYIERHEQELLYADILALDENATLQKTKG